MRGDCVKMSVLTLLGNDDHFYPIHFDFDVPRSLCLAGFLLLVGDKKLSRGLGTTSSLCMVIAHCSTAGNRDRHPLE